MICTRCNDAEVTHVVTSIDADIGTLRQLVCASCAGVAQQLRDTQTAQSIGRIATISEWDGRNS